MTFNMFFTGAAASINAAIASALAAAIRVVLFPMIRCVLSLVGCFSISRLHAACFSFFAIVRQVIVALIRLLAALWQQLHGVGCPLASRRSLAGHDQVHGPRFHESPKPQKSWRVSRHSSVSIGESMGRVPGLQGDPMKIYNGDNRMEIDDDDPMEIDSMTCVDVLTLIRLFAALDLDIDPMEIDDSDDDPMEVDDDLMELDDNEDDPMEVDDDLMELDDNEDDPMEVDDDLMELDSNDDPMEVDDDLMELDDNEDDPMEVDDDLMELDSNDDPMEVDDDLMELDDNEDDPMEVDDDRMELDDSDDDPMKLD